MSKRAPSTVQLLVIVGFALSCFAILLFLWVTFGGSTPFRAKPYQLKVPFDEATQLAEQSDVRISGVNVGKVLGIELAPNGRQALATVDIDDKYGPLPKSTRAILRTKTLLGETYIELTPGERDGPRLEDGGTLPEANVAESVQLDEIFATFDPETRAAFQQWMQEAAVAIQGQGQALSYGLGQLEPTFTEFDRLFRTLDSQRLAVGQLFSNGAKTFTALRGRNGDVADLIRSSNEVFSTAARRDRDIEALFRAFPTFLDESRATVSRLRTFAENTDPLMRQLVPAAEELSPTFIAFANLAPEAKGFFEGLEPVIERAPKGFAAGRKLFRDEFPPLLRAVDPFLRNLNPFLTGLNLYKRETTAFFGNVAASSLAVLTTKNARGENHGFLRTLGPLNPESLTGFNNRLRINRTSAYSPPGWAEGLLKGLPSFDTRACSSGGDVALNRAGALAPGSNSLKNLEERTEKPSPLEAERLFDLIQKYAFAEQESTSAIGTSACKQQSPLKSIYGPGNSTLYQQTFEQGTR